MAQDVVVEAANNVVCAFAEFEMATYTWEFGSAAAGLQFSVVLDDSAGKFTVTAHEGELNVNALWFSDEDPYSDGNTTLSKQDKNLNMNGSNTVWNDDGTSSSEKIVWDGYLAVSPPGLTSTSPDSYIVAGSAHDSFEICAPNFDPTKYTTLGVRATSTTTAEGSIKWVDKQADPDNGVDPWGDTPFIITFAEDGSPIANGDEVPDNLDGAFLGNGTNGSNSTNIPPSVGTAATDGTDGKDGGDGTTVAATDATLGGGDGGDGGNGGSGDAGPSSVKAGADGGDGGNGGDGSNMIAVASPASWTAILIDADTTGGSILGGSGGNGGDGGVGGNASGNNSGGDGGDGGDGGNSAYAIVNGTLKDVYIIGDQYLTILGGMGGTAGEGGDGGLKSGSGNNGADGANGVNGIPSAAFSDPVNVYADLSGANAYMGHLTISGSNGNDTMAFVSGGATVYATTGDDAYAFGTGTDKIIFTSADQSNGTTSTDTISGLDLVNDRIDISAIAQAGWSFVWNNVTDELSIDLDGGGVDMLINLTGLDATNSEINGILIGV